MSACAFGDAEVEEELHEVLSESYRICSARVLCLRKTSRASDKGSESSKCKVNRDEHKPCQSNSVRFRRRSLKAYLCAESTFAESKSRSMRDLGSELGDRVPLLLNQGKLFLQ